MKTYILQHVPFETPGSLSALEAEVIYLYEESFVLPKVEEIGLLIILGGPMSANDNFDWLAKEKVLIEACLAQKIPMLGICLGAQLIAASLGATIGQNLKGKEVGFGRVEKQSQEYSFLPSTLEVLHWHGETFDLPEGAKHLYRSPFCENQAFIYKERVIGLQFHLETTEATRKQLVEADSEYIEGNVQNHTKEQIVSYALPIENKQVLKNMVAYITRRGAYEKKGA